MPTRFTDDLFNNTEGSDFIVRKRLPLAMQIILIFSIAFVTIYITATIMNSTGSKTLFFLTLSIVIGSLTWFTIYFQARMRDLVLATEFQNAMLASAAQLSTRFCLIIKRDGSIVYVDTGFQKVFPNFMRSNDRNIEGLMSGAGLGNDIIQKVLLLLQRGTNDRVLLPMRNEQGETSPIMMSIDVLPRPKGYFLLRGRDYVEKRVAETGSAAMRSVAEMPLIQALNVLPEGILVTSGVGEITYINPVLEGWLGFEAGELLSRPLKSSALIYQYGNTDAGRMVSTDFTGEIVLQRKDRSLITLHIRQVSLGSSAGTSAIVSMADSLKKK